MVYPKGCDDPLLQLLLTRLAVQEDYGFGDMQLELVEDKSAPGGQRPKRLNEVEQELYSIRQKDEQVKVKLELELDTMTKKKKKVEQSLKQ